MSKFEELKIMNDTMIRYYEKMNISSERNQIIKKILDNENCFKELSHEDAILILEDIGIEKSKIEGIYLELIKETK